MRHSSLRWFMRSRHLRQDYVLKDCTVVVDGDSYFRGTYKESGCNFLLGGEFDRYAAYLKTTLTYFIDSKVTCYFVFHGAMKTDLERRKDILQKIINEKLYMVPGDKSYYEPVFVKDVYKQVLEELGFKYYVCEYGALETLLDVSKEFNCPVITNSIEYCLLDMSCITPNSIQFQEEKKAISCKILTPELFQRVISVYDNQMPTLLAVLDEDGPLYEKIPEIIGRKLANPVGPVVGWVRRQKRDQAITDLANKLGTAEEENAFRETVNDLRKLIFYRRNSAAVRYFRTTSKTTSALSDKDETKEDWFKKGVITGKIAIPYINLKNCGTFSGSWVICDKEKDDAMLPALPMVKYANSILTAFPKREVTFICRISDKSCDYKILSDYNAVPLTGIFEDGTASKRSWVSPDPMKHFVDNVLPGFDWLLLQKVPEDSHLLIITLVFYIFKVRKGFLAAYSVLLSYVMLGPVSRKVGLIKRSKLISQNLDSSYEDNGTCTFEDCLSASKAFIEYFYEGDLKNTFDRSILHELAEFQHCLQQMNYLNKLCGKRMKSTIYYKTYNGTFVFNVLLRLREHKNAINFVEHHLKSSPSVLQFYKHVKDVFDKCVRPFLN